MRRMHWTRVKSTDLKSVPSKPPKLAAWLMDMGPEHVQSDSSKEAAKAAAIEKRERRAAKWRERMAG